MDEENNGMTIGDIFRTIFSRKWLALGIALVITLTGTLALYFGWNRIKKYYTSSFSLVFPNSNGATITYPDGTVFNLSEFTSLENLNEIKEAGFPDLDVAAMYSGGAVSVSLKEKDENENKVTVGAEYTVKVKASCFSDEKQAQDFIKSIIETPVRYLKTILTEQSDYLERFDDTDFYEEKLELLFNDVNYLSGICASYQNSGRTLKKICRKLETNLNSLSKKLESARIEMRGQITEEGQPRKMIVHSVQEVKERYIQLIKTTENNLKEQQLEYDYLTKVGGTAYGGEASARLAALSSAMAHNETLLELYKLYLGEGEDINGSPIQVELVENPEYKQTLEGFKQQLSDYSREFGEGLEENCMDTLVIYDGVLKAEGNLSVFTSALLSLAVGIVVAAIVAFCVGHFSSKKKNKPEITAAAQSNGASEA